MSPGTGYHAVEAMVAAVRASRLYMGGFSTTVLDARRDRRGHSGRTGSAGCGALASEAALTQRLIFSAGVRKEYNRMFEAATGRQSWHCNR